MAASSIEAGSFPSCLTGQPPLLPEACGSCLTGQSAAFKEVRVLNHWRGFHDEGCDVSVPLSTGQVAACFVLFEFIVISTILFCQGGDSFVWLVSLISVNVTHKIHMYNTYFFLFLKPFFIGAMTLSSVLFDEAHFSTAHAVSSCLSVYPCLFYDVMTSRMTLGIFRCKLLADPLSSCKLWSLERHLMTLYHLVFNVLELGSAFKQRRRHNSTTCARGAKIRQAARRTFI